MSNKRGASDLDPEYEDISEHQAKRQRCLELNAKAATVGKIRSIIQKQFTQELRNKEVEIDMIDQRLNEARTLLDRLRACIVAGFYSNNKLGVNTGQSTSLSSSEPPSIHPAVKKYLGKTVRAPVGAAVEMAVKGANEAGCSSKVTNGSPVVVKQEPDSETAIASTSGTKSATPNNNLKSRFKVKKRIIVGNVSKYIPVDKREGNDQATHKWMVYVRGPLEEPEIDRFVKKVWFFLHPSYRPNDLVEVTGSPFHLTRRGWGEFPVRVQLHFHDERNKRVDILHVLKLDRTYTGLQTLGSETLVDIELERDAASLVQSSTTALVSSVTPAFELTDSTTPSVKAEPDAPLSTPSKCAQKSSKSKSTPKKCSLPSPRLPSQGVSLPVNAAVPPRFGTPPVGGAKDGWTHLQIKSEPSSPVPQIIQTPPKAPFIPLEAGADSGSAVKKHRRTILPALNFGSPSPLTCNTSLDGASGRVTPLMTASSAGPSPVASPAGTPSSDPGWMHVQIKSEPLSPVQKSSLGGWQSLSTLKTPPKSQPTSALSSPVLSKTPEGPQRASPVAGTKAVSMNIGNIGSKTGSNQNDDLGKVISSSSAAVLPSPSTSTVVASSVTCPTSTPSSSVISSINLAPAALASSSGSTAVTSKGGMLVIQPTSSISAPHSAVTPKMIQSSPAPAAGSKAVQPTVYMRCADNQGKIYLIPQHLLTKSPVQPVISTAAVTPHSKSVMLPSQQILGQPAPAINIQRPMQRGVIPQVICQTPPGGSLIRTTTAVGPTSIILQSTPPAGQKGVMPVRPMLIQLPGQPNLAAVTTPSPAKSSSVIPAVTPQLLLKGQAVVATSQSPTILTSQTKAGIHSQTVTPTNSRPSTPTCSILKPPSRTNTPTSVDSDKAKVNNSDKKGKVAASSLQAKPQETFVIIGGNIASLPNKPAMVFIDQETGKPIPMATQQPIVTKPSAVSLLSGTQFALAGSSSKSVVSSSVPTSSILQKPASVGGLVSGVSTGMKAVPVLSAAGAPGVRPTTQLVLLQQKGQAAPTVPVLPTQLLSQVARPTGNAAKPQSLLSFAKTPMSQSLLNPATAGHSLILKTDPKGGTSRTNSPFSQTNLDTVPSIRTTLKQTSVTQKPQTRKYAIGGDAMRLHTPVSGSGRVRKEGQELCLDDFNDLEELVSAVVNEHPLICSHARISTFLCASSVEQFLQWNVGKRRAAEWLRACTVRRQVMKHLEGSTRLKTDNIWSTKDVVLWCRAHGFSPLDKETTSRLTREIRPLSLSGIKLDSYCNNEDIWQQVKEADSNAEVESVTVSDDDADIDIISVEPPLRVKVEPNSPLKKEQKQEFIPPSEGVEYIHDTCAKIGVVLRPHEVDPVNAPGIHSSVVEDMLLAVMQVYMGDILRKSTSVIYKEHRVPEEITTSDVHKAIMALDKLDFLTNKYLGVVDGASHDSHTSRVSGVEGLLSS